MRWCARNRRHILQQRCQGGEHRNVNIGSGANTPCRASRPIKHPGRNLQPSRRPTREAATENLSASLLNQELTKIEKPAGIANPKDFRNEVVKFSLRSRAQNGGKNPSWTSYEKIREVIEKRIFSQVEDLLPVISFGSKKDGDTEKKHGEFVERMVGRGYTERQVRQLVEWYMRVKQAG